MMARLILVVLVLCICTVLGDTYLQNPRGCNDRLDEETDRQNANRLFDSQNNARGGYCWGPPMSFVEGSILPVQWTSQHGCGGDHVTCTEIIQYMCSDSTGPATDYIRDGTTTTTIPDDPNQYQQKNADGTYVYGMNENYQYYQDCKNRERNKGLFTADQNVGNKAINTRQNPNGQRYGYECTEERDYYPYWHPSPWKDVVVMVPNLEQCKFYQAESQNVKAKNYCKVAAAGANIPNNEVACTAAGGQWTSEPAFGIPPPDCQLAKFSRDNHLGNAGGSDETANYTWILPSADVEPCVATSSCNCVLRIRYNITTNESSGVTDEFLDAGDNKKLTNNPTVLVEGGEYTLALNTAQFGRTFQDRSFMFHITPRPKGVSKDTKIYNLNVRGKRGNIVQTFPATEYDFTPNRLAVEEGDIVHFQWTGCDHNPAGNQGEGKIKTDRSNIVQIKDLDNNIPVVATNDTVEKALFESSFLRQRMALIDQKGCVPVATLIQQNGNNIDQLDTNCAKLNAAPTPYFDGGLVRMNQTGKFTYMSTRNNNFSDNNFKEILTLTPTRSETLSSLEISIKNNDHATKSVISIDFENRKLELTTLAETFHALKMTFPLFLQSVSEHFLGDEDGELGNVPIVTHADGSTGSTITLPQMAAKYGEGLSESLLNRSWWGDAPGNRSPTLQGQSQSNLKKTREILEKGYFVVEHPENQNEEEQKTFQTKLDVLRKTELVLEIEEEVEVDEAQQEQSTNYEMDDSILDSWIVMGTDQSESIMNPESVIMVCGLNLIWKLDIQKENSATPSSASSHVVLLVLDVPLIRYETFPDSWAHRKSMILRVEFNDIRVEDHLLASAYRNVFTFDIPAQSTSSKKGNVSQPQNISVASVTFAARKAYGDILHYSAKIALAPVYLGVNQRTLDLLLDFFNQQDGEQIENAEPSPSPTPVYFDKFQVSPLKLVVDYKPRGLEAMDYSRVVAGGYLWLVAMIPLECASFTLSEIDITNTTLDKLPEGIVSTWMPNFLQTNIPQYIKGVQPIKIVAKMGSGVIGLVKVPIQEYKKDANILHGVGKGIQTLTFEVLNFGSRVTVSANKILKKTERMISGSPGRQPNEQKISSYANQPSDIREGAVQGMQVLLDALSGAADGIITRPLEEYQKHGNWGFVSTFLRGLPGCVLQPVIGVTGAVSKLTLGLRNTLDSKEKLKADAKYKSTQDFAFEFQQSNNNNYNTNINNSNNNNNNDNNNDDEDSDNNDFMNKSMIIANYEVLEDYENNEESNNNGSSTIMFSSSRK